MKDKVASRREKIIQEALILFAENGYADTSTKLIANKAGVSEALIFKHFTNKDQLLLHLVKAGYRRILAQNKGMLSYVGPEIFLQNMINLPQKLVSEEPLFWKMQQRLTHHEFSKQQHELFMKPVQPIITRAFRELKYQQPEVETTLLLMLIDTIWKKVAIGEAENMAEIIRLIQHKYGLLHAYQP
ncbi:transcriptional regulator, TetR family [bacterium A37T11]|nr:transcriptional regulator, TetR family [bacterium A37T11]